MKKHLLNFLLLIAPLTLITLNAQKKLEKGSIKMEFTEVSSDDPQTSQMLEMMKGSTIEVFFEGEESITRMLVMGGMVKTDTKVNKKTGKMDMYMDMMGQKMWIETTQDEAKKAQGEMDVKVVADKSDTKEILGYKAYKITISNPAMADMKISGYVTEEISAPAGAIQGMQGVDLPGFPLMIVVKAPKMSMTIETTEINDDLDPGILTVDTEGYTKMTMEEFQKSMGGMGGGFGF